MDEELNPVQVRNLLSTLEIFQGLNRRELRRIAEFCTLEFFPQGMTIFEESSGGHDLFVILEGKVAIELSSVTPRTDIKIAEIRPGELFGEFSLIENLQRSATARAVLDCKVLKVAGTKLKQTMQKHPRTGYVIMQNLARAICRKVRKTNKRLFNFVRVRLFS